MHSNNECFINVQVIFLQGYSDGFAADPEKWKHVFESEQPYRQPIPSEWGDKLSIFQKLILVRMFRPDKMVESVNDFVFQAMDQRYLEPPPFDLDSAYRDSSATIPLVFILSAGSDPMAALLKYAEESSHIVQRHHRRFSRTNTFVQWSCK